jgi:hypothetical protein
LKTTWNQFLRLARRPDCIGFTAGLINVKTFAEKGGKVLGEIAETGERHRRREKILPSNEDGSRDCANAHP